MEPYQLDGRQTVIIAILAVYLGKFVNSRVEFLRHYHIPDPVTGGFFASVIFSIVYVASGTEFAYTMGIRDGLLLIFFTCIGLSTKVETMISGGKQLAVIAVIAIVFMFLQNGVGALVARVTGLDPLVGILGGTISLAGGPGTAAAWDTQLASDNHVASANELGNAFAMLGMLLGGLLGGPVAARLITRHKLESGSDADAVPAIGIEQTDKPIEISYESMMRTGLTICISVGLGLLLNKGLKAVNFDLPDFAVCLISGILVINLGPRIFGRLKFPQPNQSRSLALVSDLSVSVVLVMSLMSMQLWAMAGLGPAVLSIMFAQIILVVLFTAFVVFRGMGSNYDAAVISSGFIGVFLGVTSTGLANVSAVTQSYGASPRALLIIPLLGAFIVDLTNPFITQLFVSLLG